MSAWRRLRVKDLGHWSSGGTPPREREDLWQGELPWLSAKDIAGTRLRDPTTFVTEEAAHAHSRVLPAGGLLIIVRGMALAHGLPVVQVTKRSAFNQDLRGLDCAPGIDPRFVYYSLIGNRHRLNRHIDQAAHGTARVTDSIYSERLAIPETSQQQAITGFLDRECARIDELQALLDSQLIGLEEQRSMEIREAVRGLRHARLKYGFCVTDCKHRTPEYVDNGYPVISTREVTRGALDLLNVDRFVAAPDYADLREGGRDPAPGDIVYSRNASVGVAAYLDRPVEVCMGQDVVLISRRPLDCELLTYVLNYNVADQVARLSLGSTFSRINVPVIRSLLVPVDAPHRERTALTSIRTAFARLAAIESEMHLTRTLVTEYRDALITEAVTGKLDVSKLSESQMDESLAAVREGERPEVLSS